MSGILTVGSALIYTEQANLSAGALNADLVASTDVSAYKSFGLQILGTWTGTLTFQYSNDNSNFTSLACWNLQGGTGTLSNTTVNMGVYGNIVFRYLRVRMTSYTSGTATGTLELYAQPVAPVNLSTLLTAQSGTWTMQPGNTANTTAWLVHTDNMGQSTTALAASASSNTVIKASAGRLARVLVTVSGTGEMDIYDNASTNSGTKIGVVPASAAVGSVYDFQMPAANGITVAGSASNPGVTISWT